MKKQTLTLIALLSRLLAGCGETPSVSNNPSQTPEISEINPVKPTVSEKPAPSATPSVKPSEAPSNSSGTSAPKPTEKPSEKPSETPSITPKPSETPSDSQPSASPSQSIDTAKNKWTSAAKNLRQEYLGGEILPYLDLGGTVQASYVEGSYSIYTGREDAHLEFSGTAKFSETLVNNFKALFEADGYIVDTSNASKPVATKESLHLKVTLVSDDDLDAAVRKAYYDEPYDKSKFTAYPSSVAADIKSYRPGHENDLPLIYLGTTHPTSSIEVPSAYSSSSYSYLLIKGSKWNDSITNDNAAVLKLNGYTNIETSYSGTVSASKVRSDGCLINIRIDKSYESSAGGYVPSMSVLLSEAYDDSKASDWTQDIKDYFDAYRDKHSLPFFYFGSAAPSRTWDNTNKKLVRTGKSWNDKFFTSAKTALAGWTIEDNTSAYSPSLKAYHKESDNCIISLAITKEKDSVNGIQVYYPKREITIVKNFDPSSYTDYSEDIKTARTDRLDGHDAPVIYLGTDAPKRTKSTSKARITLEGTTYVDEVRTLAKTTFTADGWTESTSDEGTSYGVKSLVRKKTFDDKCTLVATVKKNYSKNAERSIECQRAWNPSARTEYPMDLKTVRNDKLGGHADDIPFVYLGTKKIVTSYSNPTLTLQGGVWNNDVITNAKTAFASWEELNKPTSTSCSYIKQLSDGCVLKASIGQGSYSRNYAPKRDISILSPSSATDYDETTKTGIHKLTDNHDIPYLYLGTTSIEADKKTLKGSIQKSDRLIYLFKKSFKDWKVDESDLTARKTYEDGYKITIKLDSFYDSSSYSYSASLVFKVVPPYDKDGFTAYPSTVQAHIKKLFGDNIEIPLIYLGTNNVTSSYYSGNNRTRTGLGWDERRITDNKATLEADGYTTFVSEKEKKFGYGTSLQAYKALGTSPANGYIRIAIAADNKTPEKGNGYCQIWFDKAVTIPSGDANWAEKEENASLIQSQIQEDLPYFYIGTNPSFRKDYSGGGITIKGNFASGDRNFSYRRNAVETLKAKKNAIITDVDLAENNVSGSVTRESITSNGNKIQYTLKGDTKYLQIYAKYVPFFNPNYTTAWSEDRKNARKKALGGNVLPYLYLGTGNPDYYFNYNNGVINEIVLTGGKFNDTEENTANFKKELVLVKTALEGDENHTWTVVSDGTSLLYASCSLEDGKSIFVKVELKDSRPRLTAVYH